MLKEQLANTTDIIATDSTEAIAHNTKVYEKIISTAFNGRQSSCHIDRGQFWVYADTLEDAAEIKLKAKEYGYSNMHTLKPKYNGRLDERGAFAVSVNSSESLIIGDSALALVALFEPLTTPIVEFIAFTYGHRNEMSIDVKDEKVAAELSQNIEEYLSSCAPISGISYSVDTYQKQMDLWAISIELTPNVLAA